MKRLLTNLNFQVITGIALGVVAGLCFPAFGPTAKLISETFIKLITMLIAPIIFLTIVLGISGMSDMKKVGRVGGKALLYFEIVSTCALVIGLIVANLLRPGDGFVSKVAADTSKLAVYQKAAADMHWVDFLTHIVPANIFDAFTRGDILQILFFATLFGFALSRMGEEGAEVISLFNKISKVLFNMMGMVMRVAPIGAFGGMAFTISSYGIQTLRPLALLMAPFISPLYSLFLGYSILFATCLNLVSGSI